jgi:PAS domain S-box-containing protein
MFKRLTASLRSTFSKQESVSEGVYSIPKELRDIIDEYKIPVAVSSYDLTDPRILYCNKLHCKLTGYLKSEVVGKSPRIFQGEKTDRSKTAEMRDALNLSSFWRGTVLNYKKNGREYLVDLVIFGICHDGQKYYVAIKNEVDKFQ